MSVAKFGILFLDKGSITPSNKCQLGQFKCANGNCIGARLRCDGDRDCDDGSDETEESCSMYQTVIYVFFTAIKCIECISF